MSTHPCKQFIDAFALNLEGVNVYSHEPDGQFFNVPAIYIMIGQSTLNTNAGQGSQYLQLLGSETWKILWKAGAINEGELLNMMSYINVKLVDACQQGYKISNARSTIVEVDNGTKKAGAAKDYVFATGEFEVEIDLFKMEPPSLTKPSFGKAQLIDLVSYGTGTVENISIPTASFY